MAFVDLVLSVKVNIRKTPCMPPSYLIPNLKKHCQGTHQKRMKTLLTATLALMTGKKLSVTGLGRAMRTQAKTKHKKNRVREQLFLT
jgi:hypothetical protein